jgi:hypothetical protein
METDRLRSSLCLPLAGLLLLAVATEAVAKKGDISPVPGPGLTISRVKGQNTAMANLGGLAVRMRLSTNPNFVFLDLQIENGTTGPVKIEPPQLVLKSQGEEVDSLEPELYIGQAYEAKPYPIDGKGQIVPDDEKKLSGPVRLSDPTSTKGNSLAELMTEEDWQKESSSERMRISKELLSLSAISSPWEGRFPQARRCTGARSTSVRASIFPSWRASSILWEG